MAKKKKSKDAAASPLSPKVPLSQLLRLSVGEVDVTALQTDVAPVTGQGQSRRRRAAPWRSSRCWQIFRSDSMPAGAATGDGQAGADRAAGHGHLGQGRCDAPRDRPGRSAGRSSTAFKAPALWFSYI